ncbi:MAG: hypothetical protein WCV86_03625 [Patescibacteria group bacterium]
MTEPNELPGGAVKEEKKNEPQPTIDEGGKKKKRRVWPWVTLGVVIVVLIVLVAVSGLYSIPLLSDLFGAGNPKDLGVTYTEQDVASAEKKLLFNLKGTSEGYSLFSNMEYEGSKDVDQTLTSSELTAFANTYIPDNDLFSNMQLKVRDGGMEVSLHVTPYINAPVYIAGDIAKASEKGIALDLTALKVGLLPIPGNILQQVEDFAEGVINDRMQDIDGFTIETLEFTDDGIVFTGTHPKSKTLSEGDWL